MSSSSSTVSVLADHYIAVGREQKAVAIRAWLDAVGASLLKDYNEQKEAMRAEGTGNDPSVINDLAELRGAMSIVRVLLERMNEASDAAPAEVQP